VRRRICICVGIPLHFQTCPFTILVKAYEFRFRFLSHYSTLKRGFNYFNHISYPSLYRIETSERTLPRSFVPALRLRKPQLQIHCPEVLNLQWLHHTQVPPVGYCKQNYRLLVVGNMQIFSFLPK